MVENVVKKFFGIRKEHIWKERLQCYNMGNVVMVVIVQRGINVYTRSLDKRLHS